MENSTWSRGGDYNNRDYLDLQFKTIRSDMADLKLDIADLKLEVKNTKLSDSRAGAKWGGIMGTIISVISVLLGNKN